jgi:hypothetical protein
MSKTELETGWTTNWKVFGAGINILLALIGLLISAGPALSENASDWITGLPRDPIHVLAWPKGKKVAVCFILYVEVWGFGHGPNFRPVRLREIRTLSMSPFVNTRYIGGFLGLAGSSMSRPCP